MKFFSKTTEEETPKEKDKTMSRLFSYLWRYKGRSILVISLFTATAISLLFPGILVGVAINTYIVSSDLAGLLFTCLLIVVSAAVYYVLKSLSEYFLADWTQRAAHDLRKDVFEHMQTLSLSFFDKQPIGELMSRVLNDIDAISVFFEKGLSPLIFSIAMVSATVIVMLLQSVILTLTVLAILPLMFGLIYITGHYATPSYLKLQEEIGELNGFMEETITGAKVIKAYQMEETSVKQFENVSEKAMDAGIKANFIALTLMPLSTMLVNLATALVSLVGGILSIAGLVGVGTVASFIIYSILFARPLTQIGQVYNLVLQAKAGAERVFIILDEENEIVEKEDAADFQPKGGEVLLKDVDFSYVPGRPVLHNINILAKPGQKVGLCGPTGAGKSTIINLIPRFYDIQKGEIKIDGQSIYDLKKKSLRLHTGIVMQEPFLFTDTVLNNLKYGRLDATDEECIEAAKLAGAHDFIIRLPEGYDTVLSSSGTNLSQGQAQLLTIARAIIANRHVLILDEATSSVDTNTEKKLQAALDELMKGKTSFVIAHRLSTITNSDFIIALNNGRIEEIGSHKELMAKKGFYYNLYMSQFKKELLEKMRSKS